MFSVHVLTLPEPTAAVAAYPRVVRAVYPERPEPRKVESTTLSTTSRKIILLLRNGESAELSLGAKTSVNAEYKFSAVDRIVGGVSTSLGNLKWIVSQVVTAVEDYDTALKTVAETKIAMRQSLSDVETAAVTPTTTTAAPVTTTESPVAVEDTTTTTAAPKKRRGRRKKTTTTTTTEAPAPVELEPRHTIPPDAEILFDNVEVEDEYNGE